MLYFLETKAAEQRALLCQWVEFFYESGKKTQVVTESTLAAQHLDQMLWTFSQPSFIPHRIISQGDVSAEPETVLISVGEIQMPGWEVLVCDGTVGLEFMARYPITLHFIVLDDQDRLQGSRLVWQAAKELRVDLQHVPYSVNHPKYGWPPPARGAAASR
jgi:DNA polymerase-3 subunit chi